MTRPVRHLENRDVVYFLRHKYEANDTNLVGQTVEVGKLIDRIEDRFVKVVFERGRGKIYLTRLHQKVVLSG